jgi:N-acetylglucosamine malate deacetylase 2
VERIMTRLSQGDTIPPFWTSVLAVMAHPDEALSGLGLILDAFVFAGARVDVLCLTHCQTWSLEDAPGDLAALRGAGLASAADVLGPIRAQTPDAPDGSLAELGRARLATEVVAASDSCHPDGLLVLDAAAVSGSLDHVTATAVGMTAAETLCLPVLGWTLSQLVATQFAREFGAGSAGQPRGQVDLRVTLDRARQRVASHEAGRQALPGSAQRRRLELLADTGSFRWLRPPRHTSHPKASVRTGAAKRAQADHAYG